MRFRARVYVSVLALAMQVAAQHFNAFGLKRFTIESPHFRIHYEDGLDEVARETGGILEGFYETYRTNYHLALPAKTDILLINNDRGDGYADPFTHTILVSASEIDFPLRGTHDWLRDVLAHEYAHIVSITTGLKGPPWLLGMQLGYFTHPNAANRTEAFHLLISENLPRWFSEGIAQFESSKYGSDEWDSHRDMILRALTLSNKLLTYDHMCVFAGKLDDAEKTYNQGFSLLAYMVETYGRGNVVAILRESAKPLRLDFDGAIRTVLGISAREVYTQWKMSLQARYKKQMEDIGPQVYGRKISEHGFHNYFPRFSPGEEKIYFTSNEKREYSFYKGLYSCTLLDTVKKDERIKLELPAIKDFYSIHDPSGLIAFTSMKSRKSILPAPQGGTRTRDVFIDTLPPAKKSFNPFRKTERQISERQSLFVPSFSPAGDHIATAKHRRDTYHLCISDTAGKRMRIVYPDTTDTSATIKNIYAVDWSPDGRRIAINYIDAHNRNIGIYDTLTREFIVLCDTDHDERDPRFSHDGTSLYFSSDRTGIFNIYRFDFGTRRLARLTNVSGGAFSPDPSKNGKRLTYVNYDAEGFGIYLIDSVVVVEDTVVDSAMVARSKPKPRPSTVSLSSPREYSAAPRKLLLMPTLFMEEAVTENGDPYTGRKTTKAGVSVNAEDPFGLNRFGLALFLEPDKILKFIDPNKRVISPEVNYDLSLYGETNLLPMTLSLDVLVRGITGYDRVYDEIEDTTYTMRYGLSPSWFNLIATHGFSEDLKLHLIGGYNRFGVYMLLSDMGWPDFVYTGAKGTRVGAFLTMLDWMPEPSMNISPNGLYFKAGYGFWNQKLMTEENGLVVSDGKLLENYDLFEYHQVNAAVKLGMPTPWYDKHDLYFDMRAVGVELTENCKERLRQRYPDQPARLPSFYQPAEWIPGYVYYFQDTVPRANGGDSIYDTALVSGNTVAYAAVSYRFPVWPNSINRKLGFVYFDKLYGALNLRGGAGWERARSFLDFDENDWVLSTGTELRLETISFNILPLAVSLGWDWGFGTVNTRIDAPVGGHRFTFKIGFSFDDWEMIDYPDYHQPAWFGAVKR